MKIEITKKIEVEIKTLQVDAGVRYWEDSYVNGTNDSEGTLIPFREGDRWRPKIELETGKVINWPAGTTAEIHYKMVDDGKYYLEDEAGNEVASIIDYYVPQILSPGDNGYGDYIIMDIDENGIIQDWNPTFNEFLEE